MFILSFSQHVCHPCLFTCMSCEYSMHVCDMHLLYAAKMQITVGRGNFRQLDISYFKFMFGFNFRIVRYVRIHCSIVQKFSFGFNFRTCVNCTKIKSIQRNQPYSIQHTLSIPYFPYYWGEPGRALTVSPGPVIYM